MIRVFLFLMVLLAGPGYLQARQVVLSDNGKPINVGYPYYLEDREGNLSFQEVLQMNGSFVKSRITVPDFLGNLSKAIWYKFEVINQSQTTDWFLEIKGGFFHRAQLYLPDQAGVASPQELTADGDFEKRPVKSNDLVFKVPVKPGEKVTAYLRVDSRTLIRASMKMKTMQQLYETSILSNFGYGFMTAVAAALLLYNLFVFFSLRERVYLHYCLYIFLYIIHNSFVSGYLLMFFPWTSFINSTLWLPLMGLASIIFTNSFLQTRRYAPFIYKIRWAMVMLFIIPLTMYFMGNYQLAISVIGLVMYGLFFYWITAGVIAYRNSFKPAAYFVAGFGALIILNTLLGLNIMGILE
ncbi:MAG: 7TMR-DISM family protein [Pseudobacter sp.]|uniref:7TMR-DISM family protein n=1 Tax=Pseudobacter sp. TaxID=2045420 RepID=UPI003F7E8ABE